MADADSHVTSAKQGDVLHPHVSKAHNALQGAALIEYFYYPEMNWHFTHRWAREVIEVTLAVLCCSLDDLC